MTKAAKASKAPRTTYRCSGCGHTEPRWLGKCPACEAWNTMEEVAEAGGGRPARSGATDGAAPVPVTDVGDTVVAPRLGSGIAELDRVLGGGLVVGSFVLLGGEPGIGKSTMLAQALAGYARGGADVLYASGEESVAQTAMRTRRLGAADPRVRVLAETDVDRVLEHARQLRPAVLAIDSIQTTYTPTLDSIPGSIAQVRECAGRLMAFAKRTGTPTIIVGHVTKDGAIAGPKTLEHLVDVVLQFEGDGASPYRMLRGHKNRFGSTQELGVFEMRSAGLVPVENPSALLLAERPVGAPGSVVVASADGHRPLLVEVQALVAPATAGIGRRTVAGVDGNRLALLLAVLAQRAGCDVLAKDVFVNVAGGVRLAEPAADLAIACAVASSARGRAVDARTVMFGEVGLAGEVRAVAMCDVRLAEARRLGFARALIPRQNHRQLDRKLDGMELVPVDRLSDAIAAM
jgi:DNA repair protein RadA/Sms